jgi:hypothetical protein
MSMKKKKKIWKLSPSFCETHPVKNLKTTIGYDLLFRPENIIAKLYIKIKILIKL